MSTIARYADARPDRTAIRHIDADGRDHEWTWRRFHEQARAVRNWLAERLAPTWDHRVVAFAGNTPELVVATAAVADLGVPWVGIDPARDAATVSAQVASVSPTVVLVDSGLAGAADVIDAARSGRALVVDLARSGDSGWPRLADGVAARTPDVPWTTPPYVALGFTSGTTGVPKLFRRTRKTENQRLTYLRDHFGFGQDDVYFVTSPLAHASGHVWANAAFTLGATVVLGPGGTNGAAMVAAVERHRVTAAFMVPPMADEFLAAALARPDADLSTLRALLTGGRHVSERTVRDARRRLGDVLHVYYATTETGINTMACARDLVSTPLTAGQPMPGFRLRIVDPVTHVDRATGEVGLIAVAGPMNMDGYVHATAELLAPRDGETTSYVLTSDFGRIDGTGRLFVLGRYDALPDAGALDLVRLESALKDVAGLHDVCLVRRSGDAGDVEVVAAVVPLPGPDGAVDDVLERVRARLAELLAGTGHGHAVLDVPDIPYNTAGKVDTRLLAARITDARQPVASSAIGTSSH